MIAKLESKRDGRYRDGAFRELVDDVPAQLEQLMKEIPTGSSLASSLVASAVPSKRDTAESPPAYDSTDMGRGD